NVAARRIAAAWKGYAIRKQVFRERAAITRIQSVRRGKQTRRGLTGVDAQADPAEADAANATADCESAKDVLPASPVPVSQEVLDGKDVHSASPARPSDESLQWEDVKASCSVQKIMADLDFRVETRSLGTASSVEFDEDLLSASPARLSDEAQVGEGLTIALQDVLSASPARPSDEVCDGKDVLSASPVRPSDESLQWEDVKASCSIQKITADIDFKVETRGLGTASSGEFDEDLLSASPVQPSDRVHSGKDFLSASPARPSDEAQVGEGPTMALQDVLSASPVRPSDEVRGVEGRTIMMQDVHFASPARPSDEVHDVEGPSMALRDVLPASPARPSDEVRNVEGPTMALQDVLSASPARPSDEVCDGKDVHSASPVRPSDESLQWEDVKASCSVQKIMADIDFKVETRSLGTASSVEFDEDLLSASPVPPSDKVHGGKDFLSASPARLWDEAQVGEGPTMALQDVLSASPVRPSDEVRNVEGPTIMLQDVLSASPVRPSDEVHDMEGPSMALQDVLSASPVRPSDEVCDEEDVHSASPARPSDEVRNVEGPTMALQDVLSASPARPSDEVCDGKDVHSASPVRPSDESLQWEDVKARCSVQKIMADIDFKVETRSLGTASSVEFDEDLLSASPVPPSDKVHGGKDFLSASPARLWDEAQVGEGPTMALQDVLSASPVRPSDEVRNVEGPTIMLQDVLSASPVRPSDEVHDMEGPSMALQDVLSASPVRPSDEVCDEEDVHSASPARPSDEVRNVEGPTMALQDVLSASPARPSDEVCDGKDVHSASPVRPSDESLQWEDVKARCSVQKIMADIDFKVEKRSLGTASSVEFDEDLLSASPVRLPDEVHDGEGRTMALQDVLSASLVRPSDEVHDAEGPTFVLQEVLSAPSDEVLDGEDFFLASPVRPSDDGEEVIAAGRLPETRVHDSEEATANCSVEQIIANIDFKDATGSLGTPSDVELEDWQSSKDEGSHKDFLTALAVHTASNSQVADFEDSAASEDQVEASSAAVQVLSGIMGWGLSDHSTPAAFFKADSAASEVLGPHNESTMSNSFSGAELPEVQQILHPIGIGLDLSGVGHDTNDLEDFGEDSVKEIDAELISAMLSVSKVFEAVLNMGETATLACDDVSAWEVELLGADSSLGSASWYAQIT
ncbi:unnamed protein product, partial [Polarella glacialis]